LLFGVDVRQGAARGRNGYEMLRIIVELDPNGEVRVLAILAPSISPAPEAVDTLIDEPRNNPRTHLREQALFWLADKPGAKATGLCVIPYGQGRVLLSSLDMIRYLNSELPEAHTVRKLFCNLLRYGVRS
jgi:hypothetical protein